ncbi:MAG: hypothetical protein ACYCSS_06710 [Sulfuriferula sp.]
MFELCLMCRAVPVAYQGLWRRTLLETPAGRDIDSIVYWLQTEHWHADLRIPAQRPDFSHVQSLNQCTPVHLQWLLRQEGFAGVTQVDGERCEWHRRMDYRSDVGQDIGNMRFREGFLEEFGVERQYRELWRHEPLAFRRFSAECMPPDAPRQLLLRAGEFFMHVRPRDVRHEAARHLWARVDTHSANLNDMRQLADFEISFGTHQDGELRILLSTLPWLEGMVLPHSDVWLNLSGENNE